MIRTNLATVLAPVLALTLAIAVGGCDRQQADAPPADATASTTSSPAPSATPTAEISAPGQPSASRDPAEVLAGWAKAVEMRDWATVRAYWGDEGRRSGLSEKAFAAAWSSLLDPRVIVGKGEGEGAAGSLYYRAPVQIVDGKRTVRGDVVLRRVNDVPGATDEQLRWHIDSSTIEP